MAIRKIGDNRYYLVISRGKRNKQVFIPFTGTEAEARDAERQVTGRRSAEWIKVSEVAAQYRDWYKLNRMPRSYGELNDTFKRLMPHFGNLPAGFITASHFESYKQSRASDVWQGRTISKITVNRELKHLMAMLRWAAERNIIPAPTIKPEYYQNRHCEAQERPVSALSAQEIRDYLTALVGSPTWLIFVIMFWTGIRSKEARTLKVADIDLKRQVFRLKGKGGKVSNEPIPVSLIGKLTYAVKGKKPSDWLCPNPRTGNPYTDLRTPMETACRRAGITKRFHPHACRHTFATIMDISGASIVDIQSRLRHADVSTTRKYIKRLGSGQGVDYMGVWMSGLKKE